MAEGDGMNNLTRRNFLRIAGAAAGALSIPSALFALECKGLPVKVGMVLPQSSQYPLMADSFMSGFGLRLDATSDICSGLKVFSSESLQHMPHAGLKKLVGDDGIDLAVCLANSGTASVLDNYFPDTPMIVGNVGECMIRESDFSSTTFHCTLNHWQSSWAMGRWSALNLGRKVYIASSLFESGFDSIAAFRLGFESVGGWVMETHVSLKGTITEDAETVYSEIRKLGPDFVFALYSGRDALDFVKAFSASGLAGNIPLAGVPFMVDERLLGDHGLPALGIKSCFGWSAALQTKEYSQFVASYKAKTGRAADAFALLGYDTAGLLAAALREASSKRQLADALARAEVMSPRGLLKMDPATNTMSGPVFLREVRSGSNGLENVPIARMDAVSESDQRVAALRDSTRTGWYNAYLCA